MNEKNRRKYLSILFAFLVILNPNINMIDPLPDFIAYFIFAWVIGRAGEIVPYLSEAKSAAVKLGFVTLLRVPLTAVMLMNMYAGRDIVPLFTLIFSVIEAILLYSLVANLFAGLFYLGERCDLPDIISPYPLFGKRITPDALKLVTLSFVLTKSVLNVVPELCLISTENPTLKRNLATAYPILLVICILAVLAFGIIWATLAWNYAKSVYRGGDVEVAVRGLAGEEKLAALENKKRISTYTSTLTVLAVSTLLSFDIAFDNTGGINVLPHFIFGVFLLYVGVRLFESKKIKLGMFISQLFFTVFGLLSHYFTITFHDEYTMLELLDRAGAQKAYIPIEIFSALEAISFLALLAFLALGFRTFIRSHTGIEPTSESYNTTERDYHRRTSVKSYILFGIMALIQLLKCIKVFLDAKVELIFTETGIIDTSPTPWLGWVTVGVCVLLVGYAFYYLSDVKSDVLFKYGTEEPEAARGRYE